jgi:hypothetical protein
LLGGVDWVNAGEVVGGWNLDGLLTAKYLTVILRCQLDYVTWTRPLSRISSKHDILTNLTAVQDERSKWLPCAAVPCQSNKGIPEYKLFEG